MKIIQVDGYGRDSEPDVLMISNVSQEQGEKLLEDMKQIFGSDSIWFQLVDDDYVLSRGMEDLV